MTGGGHECWRGAGRIFVAVAQETERVEVSGPIPRLGDAVGVQEDLAAGPEAHRVRLGPSAPCTPRPSASPHSGGHVVAKASEPLSAVDKMTVVSTWRRS
jgi:hypothetical protein